MTQQEFSALEYMDRPQISVYGVSEPSTPDEDFRVQFQPVGSGGLVFQKKNGKWLLAHQYERQSYTGAPCNGGTVGSRATPATAELCRAALDEERARALPVPGWVCKAYKYQNTAERLVFRRAEIFEAPDGSLWQDVEGNVHREDWAGPWGGEATPKGWDVFTYPWPHRGRPSRTLVNTYEKARRAATAVA